MKRRHLLLTLLLALAAAPAHGLVIRLHGEVESATDDDGVLGFELLPGRSRSAG